MSETIAEEALYGALSDLCRGGSWEGVVRGMAWQVASSNRHDPRSIEMLADAAATMFASLIDEALRILESVAVQAWHEFLEMRPGDKQGALAAARLDVAEESVRLVASARERTLEALAASIGRAA